MAGSLLLMALALVALLFGSDVAVNAATRFAKRLRVSPLVIGLTLTSIGTSLPEIATNFAAALSSAGGVDASGLAVGNVIGSNLSQITLLLGVSGFIADLSIPYRSLRRDGTMLMFALLLMWAVSLGGTVDRAEAVILVVVYLAYLITVVVVERRHRDEDPSEPEPSEGEPEGSARSDLLRLAGGLLVVLVAADVLVGRGVEIARMLEVSGLITGLFVGIGTGIPELAVSIRAIRQNAGELSLGNLIGSNIVDPLVSFGIGAMVHPVRISETNLRFDFPWWFTVSGVALLLLYNHQNLNRKESSVLLLLFAFYMYLRLAFFSAV